MNERLSQREEIVSFHLQRTKPRSPAIGSLEATGQPGLLYTRRVGFSKWLLSSLTENVKLCHLPEGGS